jgi:hypothetical protein
MFKNRTKIKVRLPVQYVSEGMWNYLVTNAFQCT